MSAPAPFTWTPLDERCVNVIRGLAIDAVERAASGHPGLPLGAATMAYVLWSRHLRHDPLDPRWPDRDRFVLSAGHGSMLLYALLHLTGYDLPLEELKRFRQWGSRTPGHPEYGHTPGVETTTGPLGQGFGNAVGMALAERWLAGTFPDAPRPVVDHYTYVIASDGDMMEGVSSEAASLAGHLGLGRLIVLYDDNHISIDGSTDLAFTEDVGARFAAYGWHVQRVDGHDPAQVDAALHAARAEETRPSLIAARTHIGFGSPHKQDSAAAHGAPLGAEEARLTKRALGLPDAAEFWVPDDVREAMRAAIPRGAALRQEWEEKLDAYRRSAPERFRLLAAALTGELPAGWEDALPSFAPPAPLATRKASGTVLNALALRIPTLIGGSADLAESNATELKGAGSVQRGAYAGRNIHFGVREHAMGAMLNGLTLHGGVRPFGATFLIFSDYMRPAIRLAALMRLPVAYVFTHDSIGLGEDGPTHQPVEQLMALRAIPNLWVVRPCDAAETAEAWRIALERADGPAALVLTRQNLPVLDRSAGSELAAASGARRGGYVLADSPLGAVPDVILIGTGSEVHLCLDARRVLAADGIGARVVSLPCTELFDAQPEGYRDAVLPPAVAARVAVEAGITHGWERWVGPAGEIVGLDHFGASAPGDQLMREFGFTAEHVVRRAHAAMQRAGARADGAPPTAPQGVRTATFAG
ncbi:MAG TPA: transketolase [Gemmatimonadaceae bacterium]|nr:transketolase [Gemmatimonadaceae bacterium]